MKKISNYLTKNILCFILLCIFFHSCQEKEKNQKDSPTIVSRNIKEKTYLKGEEILPDEIGAVAVHIVDDFILLYLREQPYSYSVYDSQLRSLGKFGPVGEGPLEFMFPFYSGQFEKKNSTVSIWLNDRVKQKLFKINLTESLKQAKTVMDKIFPIDPKIGFTQNVLHLNDNKLIGNLGFVPKEEKARLRTYDISKNSTQNSALFPKAENIEKLNLDHLYQVYFDIISIKPDHSKIVSAMRSFDRIDIFDSEAKLLTSIEGDGASPNLKKYTPDDFKSLLMSYYVSLDVSDKYIYASYYNQPKMDFGRKNIPTQIHIFDWSGTQKALIQVEEYLMNIAVDEKRGFLYGVDFYNEKIMRYNLKSIL